ncbi:MAG: hypothetical protein K2X55_09200 [Burkholderiaceae bacterium]|nr:hypothetical protein [Burkholderiaceae bacterium]
MTTLPPAIAPTSLLQQRSGWRTLLLVLTVTLLVLMGVRKGRLMGDSTEYLLMTAAMASHGSVDIRSTDIAQVRGAMGAHMQVHLDALEQGLNDPAVTVPLPGFYRGLDGKVYAIHFSAYSVLAAAPYKLFQLVGINPIKCYQVVNLALVLVLGLALMRLFGSAPRALAGVALYLLSGGILYWNWSSPECMSAAALLAGFAWYCSGAPLRAGLMIGLASLQNPSIVLTLAALPVLAWCLQPGMTLLDGVKAALRPRPLAGLLLGGLLFAVPLAYNLHTFGVTSIIAKVGTSAELIGPGRLHSMFFDLNQGMIIAIPAVAAMLLLWGWRGMERAQRARRVLALLLCGALAMAYSIPAMMVQNWNSGAAGVMRYAFWCAMPFVFLLLWRLRQAARWPRAVLAVVLLLQTLAMYAASRYGETEFGPMARFVMRHAPALYNPEPEIFAERASGREDYNVDPAQVYVYRVNGVAMKVLYHASLTDFAAKLCGKDQSGAGGTASQHLKGGWIYINGPIRCITPVNVTPEQFSSAPVVFKGRGWSVLEQAPGQAAGMWSEGAASQLQLAYTQPGAYTQLVLRGRYLQGNHRTRVIINGQDTGWHDVQAGAPVDIPDAATTNALQVELRHEAPASPGPQDGRKLALFLHSAELQ